MPIIVYTPKEDLKRYTKEISDEEIKKIIKGINTHKEVKSLDIKFFCKEYERVDIKWFRKCITLKYELYMDIGVVGETHLINFFSKPGEDSIKVIVPKETLMNYLKGFLDGLDAKCQ